MDLQCQSLHFTGSAHCTQDDTGDKAVGYLFPTTELLPFAQETSENIFYGVTPAASVRSCPVAYVRRQISCGRTKHARVGTRLNSPPPPPPPPPLPPPSANSIRHNRLNSQVRIVKSTLVAVLGLPTVCFPASSGGGNRLCHGRAFQSGGGLGVLRVLSSSAGPAWP